MFRVVDRTFDSPEENLAFDDMLLAEAEETIRFWESSTPFLVLGRSGRADQEVNLAACEADGIPVLRRSSGGGTILQAPGCLNFALILSIETRPHLANVSASYCAILPAIIRALQVPGLAVEMSDITLYGKKVSGNAQRRSGGWLLHHGTLLHKLDISTVERLIAEPKRRPVHRAGRTHREFLTTIPITGEEMKQRLATTTL